jgi:hypothetical protein
MLASGQADGELVAIRTPKPTFTPTSPSVAPQAPPSAPVATLPDPAPPPPQEGAVGGTTARAVVNGPLVNLRSGPGTQFDIVATVERGAEYEIVGRSGDGAWWRVCCVNGEAAWIVAEFVDTDGPVDELPVADGSTPAAQAAPAEAAPAELAPPAAPTVAFDLRTQEQFPETAGVRIFMYVYSGNQALEGYSLRVSKDGAALPVSAASFGGQPAFTWPFQDARQRYQNFKVEFPDTPPAGVWEVQLIDSSGSAAGPATVFTLRDNDPEQELYVRYERR